MTTLRVPAASARHASRLALTLMLASALPVPCRAQAPAPADAYRGSADCLTCHLDAPPSQLIGRSQDLVTLLESQAFLPDEDRSELGRQLFPRRDPHFRSYEALLEPLGAAITDRLGWTHTGEGAGRYAAKSDQHHQELLGNARQCLSCHVNWRQDDPQPPPDFRLQGIGCEACHGGSRQWFEPHTDVAFRQKSIQEKQALGMIDVRNPIARARQCYTCHIGDAAQGKVLTHAMYAAGHPPLPAVEVETFAATTQRHWRNMAEKGEFAYRAEFAKAAGLAANEDELPRTKAMLLGAVVALRQTVQLTGDVARQGEGEQAKGWPEFAVFDCRSCHHDLQRDSWRQVRGYRGPPGHVYPPQWPLALARAAAKLESVERFYGAFDDRPFGEAREVASRADAAVEDLDKLAQRIAGLTITPAGAKRARDALLQAAGGPQSPLLDYHAAKHLVHGLLVVESELALKQQAEAQQIEVDARGYPAFPSRDAEQLATDPAARYRAGKDDFARFLQWKTEVLAPAQQSAHTQLKQSLPALGLPDWGEFRSRGELPASQRYDARDFTRQIRTYEGR